MNKLLAIICAAFVLGGCSKPDGRPAFVEEICIKGVVYYSSGYHLAPAFKQDGTLYTCDMYQAY